MWSSSEAGSSRLARKRKKSSRTAASSSQATSNNATALSENGGPERVYPCTHEHGCGKAFDRKADLDRHLLVLDANWGYACDECKARNRKIYIFARKDHLRSHLKRGVHRKQAITDIDFNSFLRHLTPKEREQKASSQQHRGSFSRRTVASPSRSHPADSGHAFGSTSSVASGSSESSAAPIAKRSRIKLPPAVPSVIDSRVLHNSGVPGSGTAVEDTASTKHQTAFRIEAEPSHRPARTGASSPSSGQYYLDDVKSSELFTEEYSTQTRNSPPRISDDQLDFILEDIEHWNHLSSSDSSIGRPARQVTFELPSHQRRQTGDSGGSGGSGGSGRAREQKHRHGRVTRAVKRYISDPADAWNQMALRFSSHNGHHP